MLSTPERVMAVLLILVTLIGPPALAFALVRELAWLHARPTLRRAAITAVGLFAALCVGIGGWGIVNAVQGYNCIHEIQGADCGAPDASS